MWEMLVLTYNARNDSEYCKGRYNGAMAMYLAFTGQSRVLIQTELRAQEKRKVS